MQRHQMKEQLGVLEEQVELLGPLARSETLEALHGLHDLVHNDSLRKSLPASDFLSRVISVLVQEAGAQGFAVAVSHYGEGRMSAEMVEVSMGAIMACLKASLRSFRTMTKEVRAKHNLFRTFSVYLEVKADSNGVQFRLVDDGKGFSSGFITELDSELQFDKLRKQVAEHGGWFSRRTFPGFGGSVEFKVPLPRARFECVLLSQGGFEVLVPVSYCTRIIELNAEGGLPCAEGDKVALLCPNEGMREPVEGDLISPKYAVEISVADVQFWLLCASAESRVKSRRLSCVDFLEDNSWFESLGLYPSGGALKALPLLEGGGLMRLYNGWGARRASI
ncbi:MAG: hypothetical protein ACXVBE_09640 [Bdellovibrionota bacterium]